MKKMTVRKMLENIVVKTAGLDVKKFYLVSMDGEVVTADFAVDLICKGRDVECPVGSRNRGREALRRRRHCNLQPGR